MTAYPGCAGLARSPFVLTEHISSLFIYLFIYMVRRTSFSARASNHKEGGVTCQSFLNQ